MDVLGSLRNLIKTDETRIDNSVFRLHYKATVIVLVGCSLLVTSRQYFGEPISCTVPTNVPADVVNTYCWIHSTFTIPRALGLKVGEEVAHPGVDKAKKGDEIIHHSYYQWVAFMLFFQAALFYIPRYIWKVTEAGKMKTLILGLDNPILPEEKKNESKKLLLEYLVTNLHDHTFYVYIYIVCEVLNFINVIGQIYFMDLFLGGEFTTYGPEVVAFTNMEQESRIDPMVKVFPRVTKCNFHTVGPSGDVQKFDSLCVLPLNIINEKIYIFLWFWMVLVAIITGICLIYRGLVILWPKARLYVLRSRSQITPIDYFEIVVRKAQLGDWFLLHLLSKNLNSLIFKDFIVDLARKIEGKELI